MTLPTRPRTVPCTRCGKRPAPAPASLDIDPLCSLCALQLEIEANGECPGWGPGAGECGNPRMKNSDLCGDCHMARCDYESPRG